MARVIMNRLICVQRMITVGGQKGPLLGSTLADSGFQQQSRTINKHFNPKWKRHRREKYLKSPLPDFEAMREIIGDKVTPAEVRAFMRQLGVLPHHQSAPVINLADSGHVIDEYVPKEGDGVVSGISDMQQSVLKKFTKVMGKRHIKKFEEDFNVDKFAEQALTIYVEAHNLLTRVFPRNFLSDYGDQEEYFKLHDLVTEFGWPQMTGGLENKSLTWKFVESLEPAKAVHISSAVAGKADNRYTQITMRFHSRQILAIYDRFGRLLHGSETVPKDNIDYVVFEKHISDTDGKWRLHSKLKPSWSLKEMGHGKRPLTGRVVVEETKEIEGDKQVVAT